MQFSIRNFQDQKLVVHIVQAVFIFVAWVLEIAVFRSSASADGRPGWYFAVCFLTVPAIIFLTMTVRFPRTRKFANPYALAAVDGVFTILWLSAFAAEASWNSAGKCGSGCHLSKAVVGLGVFIWLSFVLTTAMSVYGAIHYRKDGYLPGASRGATNAQLIDPDKEAFSTAPADDEYVPVHTGDQDIHEADSYNGESSTLPRYDALSYNNGYVPPQVHDDTSTAYSGYSGAHSGGRAQFPAASYENV